MGILLRSDKERETRLDGPEAKTEFVSLPPEIESIREDISWLLACPHASPDTLEGAVATGRPLTPLVERHIPLINRFLRQGFSRLRIEIPDPSLRLSDEPSSILSQMLFDGFLTGAPVALGDGHYVVDAMERDRWRYPVFRVRPGGSLPAGIQK